MIDSLLAYKERAERSNILDDLGLRDGRANKGCGHSIASYALLTLYRPANVDNRDAFLSILEGFEEVAKECSVVFPAHPRTQKRIAEFGLEHYFEWSRVRHGNAEAGAMNGSGAIYITEPLGYLDFLCLMSNAHLVVTDSGGIQEETTCLGVPCVTVRENTERPVTVTVGTNILAGVSRQGIRTAIRRQLDATTARTMRSKWDGKSAARILDLISREHRKGQSPLGGAAHHSQPFQGRQTL
jgi:UDP-N-acetylglucosamine 2-epimerase (non-hydrolysing)